MNVLAICCHPDDCEFECAGTLLKCVQRGDKVTVCHVANGNLGHVRLLPDELRRIRAEEAQQAGRLGGFEVVSLDVGDLRVYDWDVKQLDAVVALIRRVKPDFIITHSPDDYMPDHVAVSKLVFDASFAATVPHYGDGDNELLPVVPLFYMETSHGLNFVPTEYVDITDVIDKKSEMLACHKSQLVWLNEHDGEGSSDVIERMRAVARFRGVQCEVKYAEGFRQCMAAGKVLPRRMLP